MEKFCVFLTLRPFDLNTTLTYVPIDNFCPCLDNDVVSVVLLSMSTVSIVLTEILLRLQRLQPN
jgi:hypothetical protein